MNEIVAALWSEQEHAGRTGPPPTWAEVVAFDPPEPVRLESARLMNAIIPLRSVHEYRRLVAIEAPGDIVFDVDQRGTARIGGAPARQARVTVPIQEMRERYNQSANRDNFPLTPVLLAYPRLPVNIRKSTIMPAGLSHVERHDRRAGGQLFSVAPPPIVDQHGQLEIPGFTAAYQATRPVALPPSLWGLGRLSPRGGRGEALATRLWVAAVRLVRPEDWGVEGAPLAVPMRLIREMLYPNSGDTIGLPRFRSDLDRAAQLLASEAAAWHWYDPVMGETGTWRVVMMLSIGEGWDDNLYLHVSAPPGVQAHGPQLPPELDAYGARDKFAYRALISASFDWYQPGTTLVPNARRGGWGRGGHHARDRNAYAVWSEDALVEALAPRTPRRRHSDRLASILESLKGLDRNDVLWWRQVGRREWQILPPALRPKNEG